MDDETMPGPGGPTRPARLAVDELELVRLGNLSLRRELYQTKLTLLECEASLVRVQILARYGVPPDEAAQWHLDPVGGCYVQRGDP